MAIELFRQAYFINRAQQTFYFLTIRWRQNKVYGKYYRKIIKNLKNLKFLHINYIILGNRIIQ